MSTDPFDSPAEPDPFDSPATDDPFDAPAFDPATGELLDDVPTVGTPTPRAAAGGGPQGTARELVRVAADAIPDVALDLPAFAGALRRALSERVAAIHDELLAARAPGPVTDVVVAPELRALADAHETLQHIGKAFTTAAGDAKAAAGAVVAEVRGDRDQGGSTSLRVAAGGTEDVKVTVTQATQAWADDQAIIDVLVPALIAEWEVDNGVPDVRFAEGYGQGARDMAKALWLLLAKPSWKTSALDEAVRQLADGTTGELATRLRAAYGRKPVGEPTTKVERVERASRTRTLA